MLICPSDTGNDRTLSYTYSLGIGANGGTSLAALEIPTQTVTFADARGISNANRALIFYMNATDMGGRRAAPGVAIGNNASPTAEDLAGIIAADRHLEGANYAFMDGHVKWGKSTGTIPVTNPGGTYAAPPKIGYDFNANNVVGGTNWD